VSCAVSPGFTYEDFKLFNQKELLNKYPEQQVWIKKQTRKYRVFKKSYDVLYKILQPFIDHTTFYTFLIFKKSTFFI
jgi:hypothetical protein